MNPEICAEMMALSRPRPRLGWSGRTTRMRGVWGPLAGRYRRRLERPQRRQGDHADRDAVLGRPRRAGSHRVIPARSGSRRPAPPDHQGPHDRQTSSRRRLARAGARTAPGQQTGPFGRYGPAGSAGRWPLAAALRRTQPGSRLPTAAECTHFARRIRRCVGWLAALAGGRASVSRLTRTAIQGPACGANRLPAPAARRGWAPADQPRYAVPRDARRHVRPRLPARCARTYWRTIAVTICPGKSGHK